MPAIKLIDCGCGPGLTSRPFAGDDLQIMCLIGGVYRLIQMACLLPFWAKLCESLRFPPLPIGDCNLH